MLNLHNCCLVDTKINKYEHMAVHATQCVQVLEATCDCSLQAGNEANTTTESSSGANYQWEFLLRKFSVIKLDHNKMWLLCKVW